MEKACEVFSDFGELHALQALLLAGEAGYELEARDSARKALEMPLWTLGNRGAGGGGASGAGSGPAATAGRLAALAGKGSLADMVAALDKVGSPSVKAAREHLFALPTLPPAPPPTNTTTGGTLLGRVSLASLPRTPSPTGRKRGFAQVAAAKAGAMRCER